MTLSSPDAWEVAQFVIPRTAFAAINPAAVQAQARADGLARSTIEANAKNAGGNKIRLTCRVVMARRVIESLDAAIQLAERRHDANTVEDLQIARAAALDACEEAGRRSNNRVPLGEAGYVGPSA